MKKSVFNLSHERQLTCKADGTLYPIFCEAALPSGKYKLSTECLARMTPLINPVYSRFDLYLHYFFVPNRLVWENWEEFINPSKMTNTPPVFPEVFIVSSPVEGNNNVTWENFSAGSLADHLGVQVDVTKITLPAESSKAISLLPFRCYQQIWNDHFRDTDLEDEIPFPKTDGYEWASGQEMEFVLRKKAWEKDYFTSARPYPQRGTPQVVVTSVPEFGSGEGAIVTTGTGLPGSTAALKTSAGGQLESALPGGLETVNIDTHAEFSIEDLREANAIQNLLERSLKAGAHYFDMLKTFFGVRTMDSRFQRSEFIGGARQAVTISEVLQTSQSETTPLGTYGGHGISAGSNRIGFFVAPEHGYIIGLLSIMPRATYINQIRRDFFKNSRFDFYFPELANLGEQDVYSAEVTGKCDSEDDFETFGYQERWAEHRFIPSTVHGQFRSDAILKNFTAARAQKDTSYVLEPDFIHVSENDDINRVFAIDDYDPFLVNVMNHCTAVLPIPRHSNPSLL